MVLATSAYQTVTKPGAELLVTPGKLQETLIGAEQFALMGPETIFINISRGKVVDEAAMIDALREAGDYKITVIGEETGLAPLDGSYGEYL